MDADRVAVDAADRLVRLSLASGAAGVAQDELVGRQRDGLADGVGRHALGQGRGRSRLGGLLGRRPRRSSGSCGRPRRRPACRCPERLADQLVLIEQLGQEGAGLVGLRRVLPLALALDAVADRLAQQGVGMLAADQARAGPRRGRAGRCDGPRCCPARRTAGR